MTNDEIKVLLIDVVSELGGAQHSMFELCRKLKESGVTVEVALPSGPLSDKFSSAGFTVYPVSPMRASRKGFALFMTAVKLLHSPHTVSQIVRGCKPDLVHANSLAAFMTTAHVHSSIPVIWHVRDIQSNPRLIRSSVRRANALVTASETIDEQLTDMVSPRHRSKLRLVRNGIDPSIFEGADKEELRIALNLPVDKALIGMAAHMIPWKKHDVFIESAALISKELPDAHFALIGRDLFNENRRYIKQLKKLVADKGIEDRFHWVTDCSGPESFMAALDLLVHPARHEPFGRIICEAMAAGVPVVAADTGGPATIISDKTDGRLAVNGTAKNFAEIAVELLQNPADCQALVTHAREHVLKTYSVDRVCKDMINVYKDTLRSHRELRNYKPDKD